MSHRFKSIPGGRFGALRSLLFVGLVCRGLFAGHPLAAHTASTAWLSLSVSNSMVTGSWEIALRDLDLRLGLDANDDGRLTWGELKSRRTDIAAYALEHLLLNSDGDRLRLRIVQQAIATVGGMDCLQLQLEGLAPKAVRNLSVDYRLLFEMDPLHRGLVNVSGGGVLPGSTAVLGPNSPVATFSIERPAVSPIAFVREGIHHIGTGYDHLLFLLALLLPAVVTRGTDGWRPVASLRPVVRRVLQVVTAFTIAHSLTLALATFDVVRLPTRWVECTIAVSIAVAAVANLRGRMPGAATPGWQWSRLLALSERRPWLVPFGFGLIHGFGFADALKDLGLARAQLVVPLLGFNAGVELGQLACVALVLPLIFWVRRTSVFRSWGLPLGSWAILIVASGWVVDRAFDFRWVPF